MRRAVGRRRGAARLGWEDLITAVRGCWIGLVASRAILMRVRCLRRVWRKGDCGIEDEDEERFVRICLG